MTNKKESKNPCVDRISNSINQIGTDVANLCLLSTHMLIETALAGEKREAIGKAIAEMSAANEHLVQAFKILESKGSQ